MINWQVILWSTAFWAVSLLFSVVIVVGALVCLPADHFDSASRPDRHLTWHPFIRWGVKILKNVAGIVTVLVGFFLSLPGIPGQGVLTVLVGLLLVDLPGKRRWERALMRRPGVRRVISRLRRRFGQPPFDLESAESSRDCSQRRS